MTHCDCESDTNLLECSECQYSHCIACVFAKDLDRSVRNFYECQWCYNTVCCKCIVESRTKTGEVFCSKICQKNWHTDRWIKPRVQFL